MTTAALFILVASLVGGSEMTPIDRLLDAIMEVESGGDCDAVGDGGMARGPFQIHGAYWQDACEQLLEEGKWPPSYVDGARSISASTMIVRAYWRRYEPKAYGRLTDYQQVAPLEMNDMAILARCHNGGCNWRKNPSATDGYWAKVKAALEAKK